MKHLYTLFTVFGTQCFLHLLGYMIAARWYKNNPEAEKTQYYEQLDAFFGRKYVKIIVLAAGIIFLAASIVILDVYGSAIIS